MRIPVHAQTEEVAGGRCATSARPPRATLVPATKVSSPHTLPPIRSSSVSDTPGALLGGLRWYPLSARSQKQKRFLAKPSPKPRNSR
jgi:hypothetical protein